MTPKIAGYELSLPTLTHIRGVLEQTMGPSLGAAAWQDLCGDLKLDIAAQDQDIDAVEKATQWLLARSDLGRVVGCSISIRLIAFKTLASRTQAQLQGGSDESSDN